MGFHKARPSTAGFGRAFDRAEDGVAGSVAAGLSGAVSEPLADPIARAGRIDRISSERLVRRIAAKDRIRATLTRRRG